MDCIPYLIFNGNTEDAINHYVQALGGNILMIQRFGEMPGAEVPEEQKGKVLHATVDFPNFKLMFSDSDKEHLVTTGTNISLSVNCHSKEEADKAFNGISEGGKITMPLQDTFWGAYFGMCTDKFGVSWMFNYDYPKA